MSATTHRAGPAVALGEIRPEHRAELDRSGIAPEVIAAAGIRSVDHAEAHDRGFRNGGLSVGGLLFPFPDLATGAWNTRFALLKPDLCSNGAKYLAPYAERLRLHFAPGTSPDDLRDATIPILIIEGIKKALAVESWRRRDGRRALVIGISGCWGWRHSVKGPLPDGTLGKVASEPIPDLDLLEWNGRTVTVAFDGDVVTNKSVGRAERAFVAEVKKRGAAGLAIRIPPAADGTRQGADDFLVAEGDGAWARLLDRAADPSKPRITITLDVIGTVDEASAAITKADAGVYQRVQTLVRVVQETGRPHSGITRPAGAPLIASIGDAGLLELLADAADWISIKKTGEERLILPPKNVRDAMRERKVWPGLPWLEGVISGPTMRPDGSILSRPGYDAGTGLLYLPGGVAFPPIKKRPTRDDARAALVDLTEPFEEFPFTEYTVGLAVTVAAVLTLIGRAAFDGPAPMFPVRSPTPGSGKDLLACGVGIIGTGREPARTTAPRGRDGDTEWRKRILAHALAGDPAILIGNVDGVLRSATLADTLTKTTLTERLLGSTENVTIPIRAVWLVSGNGLGFGGDLGRRVVPVELDPGVEYPEDREGPEPGRGWKHSDLLAYIRAERPRLVAAALTVLRAFDLAGRPTHGKPPKGSFEAWDKLIRAAVIWAADTDPLAACETIRSEADSDLDGLRSALACWRETFTDRALTAAEAVAAARAQAHRDTSPDPELLTALATLAGCDVARLDGRALGYTLRRVQGRPVGGVRFNRAGANRNAKIVRWNVVEARG